MLRVKFLRMSRGLRQEQVAALLHIPRPHVSQIENGVRNPTPQQIDALARVFDCAPDRLFQRMETQS